MRAKINQEGNKLNITIKGTTFTKYINKCILCGKESVDDTNKGAKHICDKCYDLFETNKTRGTKPVVRTNEIVKTAVGLNSKPKKRKYTARTATAISSPIVYAISQYKPSIRVVNLVEYQNLMDSKNVRMNAKTMTAFIDLIIKGVNTANKIAKTLKISDDKLITSIRTYLCRMERFGLVKHAKRLNGEGMNNNIFTVGNGVVYTAC